MHIILLIHGTWGRGIFPILRKSKAAWCEPNSILCKSIISQLNSTNHIIDYLVWSGNNTSTARLKAADDLTCKLTKYKAEFPFAHIHIIAHSHAGNAAMYCLRDCAEQFNIGSLTCLSTPFLHVRARKLQGNTATTLRLFIKLSLFFSCFGACHCRITYP